MFFGRKYLIVFIVVLLSTTSWAKDCTEFQAFYTSDTKVLFDEYLRTPNLAEEVLYGPQKHYIVFPLGQRYIQDIGQRLFENTTETECLVWHLKSYILLLSSENPEEFRKLYPKIVALDAEITKRYLQYRRQFAEQKNDYVTDMALKGGLVGVAVSVIRYVPWRSKRIPFLERKFWNELGALSVQYAFPGLITGVIIGSVRVDKVMIPDVKVDPKLLNYIE